MDFEKKYPIAQNQEEFLLLQWTRGYRQVDVYYNDELISQVTGHQNLQNGVQFYTDQLGEVKLNLSEKPITLNVIIDGFHSPVNVSHPVKELQKTAFYFWIISVFALIAGGLEVGVVRMLPDVMSTVLIINTLLLGAYITSAILVQKGIPFGFYLGSGVFCLMSLLSFLILLSGSLSGLLFYIFGFIRIAGIVLLATNLKTAIQASKHRKYKISFTEDLLDAKL